MVVQLVKEQNVKQILQLQEISVPLTALARQDAVHKVIVMTAVQLKEIVVTQILPV